MRTAVDIDSSLFDNVTDMLIFREVTLHEQLFSAILTEPHFFQQTYPHSQVVSMYTEKIYLAQQNCVVKDRLPKDKYYKMFKHAMP